MQRNLGLLAIGITLCGGAVAQAQGPMPSPYPPAPHGYGYPMPAPYGQSMPTSLGQRPAPYPQPMLTPYGQPLHQPAPNLPYPGNQPMLPPAQGNGPGQPYYVTDMPAPKSQPAPKSVPTNPAPAPITPPSEPPPGEPVTIYEGPSSGLPIENEPVALYEGNRYAAAVKLDHTRTWVQASYLHWWVERPTVTPLVNSGTTPLLVGEIGPKEFSGIQVQLGHWLDPEHNNALEITGQWLGKSSLQYIFNSNAAGAPPLSIPINGGTVPVAAPGTLAGSIYVDNIMSFHGAEVNLSQNVLRVCGWTFDYFAGGRYLYMNDNLSISQTRTGLTNGAVSFLGGANPAGTTVYVRDSFNVDNRFYGGDIGARLHWTHCRFDVGVSAKVALGATCYRTIVDGSSTVSNGGGTATRTGGTFAQASNIGRFSETQFTAIPEAEAVVSYQLTDHIRVLGGYSFLYWNRVQRAADQIDRTVNLAQAPTSPTFNPNATGSPIFPNARTGFLIQSVNIGLEFKY